MRSDYPYGTHEAVLGSSRLVGAAEVAPERLGRLLDELKDPNTFVVLVGEAGSGRTVLAEEAADIVASREENPTLVVKLPTPPRGGLMSVFGTAFPDHAIEGEDPSYRAETVGSALKEQAAAEHRDRILFIAPNVDMYRPRDLATLMFLHSMPGISVIGSAARVTGALSQWTTNTKLVRIAIKPLTLAEADRLLSGLLGVRNVVPSTLRRWHTTARGNTYLLSMLALEAEGKGRIRRSRDGAWTTSFGGSAPRELAEAIEGICDAAEWEVLQEIALLEPVSEPAILRALDARALRTLMERDFVISRRQSRIDTELIIGHPMMGESIRQTILPNTRHEIFDRAFIAVRDDLAHLDPLYQPDRLLRLVLLGISAGKELPFAWIWAAFEYLKRSDDTSMRFRIAQHVIASPEATPAQIVMSADVAVSIARYEGDEVGLERAISGAAGVLARAENLDDIPVVSLAHIRVELLLWHVTEGRPEEDILAELDALDASHGGHSPELDGYLRSVRTLVLAWIGRLSEAVDIVLPDDYLASHDDMWSGALGSAIRAMILTQMGKPGQALAEISVVRNLHSFGPASEPETSLLISCAWMFGLIYSGDLVAAHEAIVEFEGRAPGETPVVLEAGNALIAIEEGDWSVASGAAERLLNGLSTYDSYGMLPLAYAIRALAAAALGDRALALQSLQGASVQSRGISRALDGFVQLLTLRTKQWLHMPDLEQQARETLDWARGENLHEIELHALHVAVCARGQVSIADLDRATWLAVHIQSPKAHAVIAHMKSFADPHPNARGQMGETEERMLAGLGVHLPPPAPATVELTVREREVMSLAALGYSSKFIADRLHISARTVETHLARVFTKLGVTNRDELGAWAARERRGIAD